MDRVRIDKWLWAARFYKTRSIAKQAIETGKVRCQGQRIKPSREIEVGTELVLKVGWDEKTVIVEKLSEQRRGAVEAQLLYHETPESIAKREALTTQRKLLNESFEQPVKRPSKKERRQIHRFREQDLL